MNNKIEMFKRVTAIGEEMDILEKELFPLYEAESQDTDKTVLDHQQEIECKLQSLYEERNDLYEKIEEMERKEKF